MNPVASKEQRKELRQHLKACDAFVEFEEALRRWDEWKGS